MTCAGATFWIACLGVLEHVVANMDSLDSGFFCCSTLGPKPSPGNWTKIKSFLGLASWSYYRHFVPGFASVAGPLYQLTEPIKGLAWILPVPAPKKIFFFPRDQKKIEQEREEGEVAWHTSPRWSPRRIEPLFSTSRSNCWVWFEWKFHCCWTRWLVNVLVMVIKRSYHTGSDE